MAAIRLQNDFFVNIHPASGLSKEWNAVNFLVYDEA